MLIASNAPRSDESLLRHHLEGTTYVQKIVWPGAQSQSEQAGLKHGAYKTLTSRRLGGLGLAPIDIHVIHTRQPSDAKRRVLESRIPTGTRTEGLIASISHEDQQNVVLRIILEVPRSAIENTR